jgi:hypothetical protein
LVPRVIGGGKGVIERKTLTFPQNGCGAGLEGDFLWKSCYGIVTNSVDKLLDVLLHIFRFVTAAAAGR